ncbi:MAG TPA: hypothetical protein VLA98_08090 [Solirubrobacteraceae bacterium]|nr:hypothetical protein [Solirubrobacteraceae bacterium]
MGYLDAGSGSMILQVLLGGVAALVVSIKLWWNKLLRLLRIRKDDAAAGDEAHAAATEPSAPAAATADEQPAAASTTSPR